MSHRPYLPPLTCDVIYGCSQMTHCKLSGWKKPWWPMKRTSRLGWHRSIKAWFMMMNLSSYILFIIFITSLYQFLYWNWNIAHVDVMGMTAVGEHCGSSNGYSNGFRTRSSNGITSIFPAAPVTEQKCHVDCTSLPLHVEAMKLSVSFYIQSKYFILHFDKKYINKKERERHLPGYCQ